MNRYIEITTEALRNDSGTITELVLSAEQQLQKIYSEVEMLDGMWEGPANQEFVRQFAQDYELFMSVCKFVKNFAEDMNDAAKEYDRCEDDIFSTIKAIRV